VSATGTTGETLIDTSPGTQPTPSTAASEWDVGVSNSVSGLTITVNRVELEGDGTATLFVSVDNQTADSINLPLFGYFIAVDSSGVAVTANPAAGNWPRSFAPRGLVVGEIRLEGWFGPDATEFRIEFSQVFGTFDIDSIGVAGIPIP